MAISSRELPHEGAQASYCPRCGVERTGASGFCGNCGTQFAAAAAVQAVSKPWQAWVSGICSAIALVFLPPVFGGVAIYLAVQTRKWNESLGSILLAAAVLCTLVGMVIGVIVFTTR